MKRKQNKKDLLTWADYKKDRFKKNPDEAIGYLKVTLEENSDIPELVADAVREVAQALGISVEQIARRANKSPSTIHKALSASGNPTLETLTAVLKILGLKLSVKRAS